MKQIFKIMPIGIKSRIELFFKLITISFSMFFCTSHTITLKNITIVEEGEKDAPCEHAWLELHGHPAAYECKKCKLIIAAS